MERVMGQEGLDDCSAHQARRIWAKLVEGWGLQRHWDLGM